MIFTTSMHADDEEVRVKCCFCSDFITAEIDPKEDPVVWLHCGHCGGELRINCEPTGQYLVTVNKPN